MTLLESIRGMCLAASKGKEFKRPFGEERVCDAHGKYVPFELICLGKRVKVESCPLCKENEILEWKNRATEEAARVAEAIIRKEVPRRFWFSSVSSYYTPAPRMKAVKARILEFISRPEGKTLLFTGNPGTGKTHLGYAVYKYFLIKSLTAVDEAGIEEESMKTAGEIPKPVITSALDLVRGVKESWRGYENEDCPPRFRSEKEALSYYGNASVLIIDEIGVQFQTETEKLILTEVINRRYEQMLPLIAISNSTLEDLKPLLGERVVDRFSEILKFDWQSWREKAYA